MLYYYEPGEDSHGLDRWSFVTFDGEKVSPHNHQRISYMQTE